MLSRTLSRTLSRNVSRLSQQRFSSSLVLADHDNSALGEGSLAAITAASQIGHPVTVLVAGENCASVAEQAAKVSGVEKVLVADDAAYGHNLVENATTLLENLQTANNFSHILAPTTAHGKNVLPRLAAKLDVQPISDILSVKSPDTFTRPIYAGNAIATVTSSDAVKLLTVRPTAFDKAAEGGAATSETVEGAGDCGVSSWKEDIVNKSERPELGSAKVVVAGGRGLKEGENFKMLEEMADHLGGAVGASRAAVDAGMVPNDMQIGQTGKVVAPDLYVAVGISGAIQHLAGMKDSKTIVAINKDEEAPIFAVSDYGLVADLFDAVPEMNKAVAK